MASQDFADRPLKKLVLFDVDGTLTPARQVPSFSVFLVYCINTNMQKGSLEMLELLRELRKKVVIGFVGGSDLVKITDQLTISENNREYGVPTTLPTRANDLSIVRLGFQPSTISTLRLQRMD